MNKKYSALKKYKGFSMVEIMVVILIMGIMAAVVVSRVGGRGHEARVKAVFTDMSTIEAQLDLYKLDNYRYPTAGQGLQALVEKPSSDPVPRQWQEGGYIKALPIDPWGSPYNYAVPGEKGDYDLYSFGADNAPGGTGDDKDIYSWERFEASAN